MKPFIFIALSACGLPRDKDDVVCAGLSDKDVAACVVGELNLAAKDTLFAYSAGKLSKQDGTPIEISFVDRVKVPEGLNVRSTAGNHISALTYKDHWLHDDRFKFVVQISKQDGDFASLLIHELGHVLQMQFVENPTDPVHSSDKGDIMFFTPPDFSTYGQVDRMIEEYRTNHEEKDQ